MRCPSLLTILLVLSSAHLTAAQQPTKVPRLGLLNTNVADAFTTRTDAFRHGLRELGYVEGKTILIDYRYAEGNLDRLTSLAAELVRLKVDIIVTGVSSATRSAKQATNTIPIVMAQDNDPMGTGRRQLGTAWRKHYRTVKPVAGDRR